MGFAFAPDWKEASAPPSGCSFSIRKRYKAECLFLEAPDGGARLELIRYDAPPCEFSPFEPSPHEPGLRHIAFEVEDIDATIEQVRALGITPISPPVEVPFRVADLGVKRLAYFHDFDGTLVEIASYQK